MFTKNAEALYLHSSSELQRLSLSATCATTARCYLPQPSGEREDAASDDANSEGEEAQNETPLVNGNADSKEGSVGGEKVSVHLFDLPQ